jgi:hypothetical protein
MAETAEERKKRVDAFKKGVEKGKPKDLKPISPGMEEDKTSGWKEWSESDRASLANQVEQQRQQMEPLKKAKGGGLGCGAAMRGYGAVRKK